MIIPNKIVFIENDKILKDIVKRGRDNYFIFTDGTEIKKNSISLKIKVPCIVCNEYDFITLYGSSPSSPLIKEHLCQTCNKTGENKHHTVNTKNLISAGNTGKVRTEKMREKSSIAGLEFNKTDEGKKLQQENSIRVTGENNPFYNKQHPPELMDHIVEKRTETIANRTEEEKRIVSENISKSQRKLMKEDPTKYRENKAKGGMAATKRMATWEMNSIEKIVNEELIKRSLDFKYAVVLGFKQFDFGNKKHRILLEVQGDYWHANPNLFGEKEGKRKINDIQLKKLNKDKLKYNWAIEHNFRIFYIWEEAINKKDFTVLDELKTLINYLDTISIVNNDDKSLPPA